MIKSIIRKELQSDNQTFNISDNIRVLLNKNNEYIAKLQDVKSDTITIMFDFFTSESGKNYKRNTSDIEYKTIYISYIAKFRIANAEENFCNTFYF